MAFASAEILFSKLNHTGYEAEITRYNEALEDLAKAKEARYKNEVAKKDKIEQVTMQLSDAKADIKETNKPLDELRTINHRDRTFDREPQLSDYFKPSNDMTEYQCSLDMSDYLTHKARLNIKINSYYNHRDG